MPTGQNKQFASEPAKNRHTHLPRCPHGKPLEHIISQRRGIFRGFLIPPIPVLSSVASVVPITSPASVVPMTVPEIRPIAIIRRIVSAPIDGIRWRSVNRTRVVVGSGCPYRNAERRYSQRKADHRPSIPGVRLARAECQQNPKCQNCDQYCRKQGLHLSPPPPCQACLHLLD